MSYLLITHTVRDYAKWKPVFDQHGTTRKSAGCRSAQVFQDAQDPNKVTVLMEWDSANNARKFTESTDLRQIMEKAGVVGKPEVRFLGNGERQSA